MSGPARAPRRLAAGVAAALLAWAGPAVGAAHAQVPAGAPAPGSRVLVDDFENPAKWSAHPADGVELAIGSDAGVHGRALRLDVHFSGGAGYAVARRAVSLDLPANYRFRFAVRGDCPPNDLEFKLIDQSGDNVWWCNRRGFHFPAAWDSLTTRKRQIVFAWGPLGGGEPHHVAAIEFAITAGSGGRGTVWLDDLTLEALPPPPAVPPAPRARASSARSGHAAAAAADGDSATFWASAPGEARPWLALDLGMDREFGGVTVDWVAGRRAADYDLEVSDDGEAWRAVRAVRGGGRARDALYLPESEARWLRLRAAGAVPAGGIAIRELTVEPLAWSASPSSFFEALARDAPRGDYPRGLSGEQVYWTVVGADGAREEALLSEDGMLETGKAQFSIEPFLWTGSRLITWSDVAAEQRLAGGDLPIPSVRWPHDDLELTVTAFAAGGADASSAMARYRVRNLTARRARATLFLALRPFQVNPPAQFLNFPGGVARIESLEREGAAAVRVNGDRLLRCRPAPSGFGAATFDRGDVVADFLRRGRLPREARVYDPFAHASGAMRFDLDLPAGEAREVDLEIPLGAGGADSALDSVSAALASSRRAWAARAGRVAIELPDRAVAQALGAQLGWILVNRDGPAIQPGSRSYERSWIRDGALTCTALLRLGQPEVVREFIDWFAGYLYPDGKVPCCVDRRGADPVPENDSGGEFIYLVAEYHRYTGDRALVERLWPKVARAAAYLDSLRRTHRTAEWRGAEKRPYFGLLPASISHEGYSAKPMHSYWDDFFALRGFRDAVYLAGLLGRGKERARLSRIRDQFAGDLSASVRAAIDAHRIDYVPGCADLGDFDATSTTIALSPTGAADLLPPEALRATFERYWTFFRERRDGVQAWEAFTPYEVRTIGAFVRLGWRDRANELLSFFMDYRRPPGWQQWPEVVRQDLRKPGFLGDLPHTWVGSDFVRSVLDMLCYERGADSALVIGAGVPFEWVAGEGGVTVRGLPTPYGKLDLTMRAREDQVEVRVGGELRVPPGGIEVSAPPPGAGAGYRTAKVNGRNAPLSDGRKLTVRALPAIVTLRR